MLKEKEDPDDVCYGIDGVIRITTEADNYIMLRDAYEEKLDKEIENLTDYLNSKVVKATEVEEFKIRIIIYSKMIYLLNKMLSKDKKQMKIQETVYDVNNKICENESVDYYSLEKILDKRISEAKKKTWIY